MKTLIKIFILTILLSIIVSGCIGGNGDKPTAWHDGVLKGVSVTNTSSTIIIYRPTVNLTIDYTFHQHLDVLNTLNIGEQYRFGICAKYHDEGSILSRELVEIRDVNNTLIWKK